MTDILRVFAEVDLNDHEDYYGGYKHPKVLEWHPIQRGLSDHTGQIQHLSFGAIFSDTDYFFRTLLDDPARKYLTNRPSTVRIIDDEDRRLEVEPMVIANGFIGDYSPLDNLRFEVKCHDWMKRRFTRRAASNESWQPRITLTDFPNANGTVITDSGGLDYMNAGRVIPIIYGRITDTKLAGDWPWDVSDDPLTDEGDGQFVPIYVGDYTLSGETWRGALVAAHHCKYIEAGFLFHDPVDLRYDEDWLTPRRLDGAWFSAGFDITETVTIHGRDYCMIFLKGYAGDVFCGKEPIPEIRQGKFGNVPIAINVWGRTDNGRYDGVILTDGFDIYLDFLSNYVASETRWMAGLALEIPEFPTMALQLIDTESFTAARQTADLRLGGGYTLDFALGANNQAESLMDVIAEFNVNLDCEQYFNQSGQFSIAMEPEDDSDAEPAIDDITDITAGTFQVVDQVARNFWNVLPFRHTFDYTGRMQAQFSTDWRSEMTGDLERRHESSIANYEQERPSSVYEFRFIRGRNRLSDSPYYDQGRATVEDVMMHLAARYADPMRIVTLAAPFNLLHYECGDVFPISSVEGIGASGWAGRMVRIINHTVHPSKGHVVLDCYDLRTVIEAREELTTSTGGSPGGSPEYSLPEVGSPGLAGSPSGLYGPQGTISCPVGAVAIAAGADIQAAVTANPNGTAFCLGAGTHTLTSAITPKTGNTFVGATGAVISGASVLTGWTVSGATWYVTGQTQAGTVHGSCQAGYPRCGYPEDLYMDNVLKLHVATLGEVGAGEWFFDYAADRIYVGDNPAGKTVETTVVSSAFTGAISNVTIANLTIEKFASPGQAGAIDGTNSTGWTVTNNVIRYNHGYGVRLGTSMQVLNNYVHSNGQLGVGGVGNNILVEGNEIAYNNTTGYDPGWEAGGTKFAVTDGLVVRGNFVHHNDGPGLWTDIDNINTLYEDNLVEDNTQMGIFHEISYAAIIRNNTVRRNATTAVDWWLYGAGIFVSSSKNVEVYGNIVENNYNGITAVMQNRGSGIYGLHELANLHVHDNTVTQITVYAAGLGEDIGDSSYCTPIKNNRWVNNDYFLGTVGAHPAPFAWCTGARTPAQWQSPDGQDLTGSFTRP